MVEEGKDRVRSLKLVLLIKEVGMGVTYSWETG